MTKRQRKQFEKKFEIIAGILAGIGSIALAIGAFNNWFVIVAYVFFLVSALMYIWWSKKYGVYGILIMNLAYFFSDIVGIGSWVYNILK